MTTTITPERLEAIAETESGQKLLAQAEAEEQAEAFERRQKRVTDRDRRQKELKTVVPGLWKAIDVAKANFEEAKRQLDAAKMEWRQAEWNRSTTCGQFERDIEADNRWLRQDADPAIEDARGRLRAVRQNNYHERRRLQDDIEGRLATPRKTSPYHDAPPDVHIQARRDAAKRKNELEGIADIIHTQLARLDELELAAPDDLQGELDAIFASIDKRQSR